MITRTDNAEYHRLDGHLPMEILELITDYAQPLYRKPNHYFAYSPLLSGMKMVIVNNILKQHVQSLDNHRYRKERTRLLVKQTGELFEDIESSRNMLVDIRAMIKSDWESRNKIKSNIQA